MSEEKFYVVENYDSDELKGFTTLDRAAQYVRDFYVEHFSEWYRPNCGLTAEDFISGVRIDLENLFGDRPYIEDCLYIHEVPVEY